MNFEIGQSLTYDQAKQLPDGAQWEMVDRYTMRTVQFTAPLRDRMNSNDEPDGHIKWYTSRINFDEGWHSHKLIYLPPATKPEQPAPTGHTEIAREAAVALLHNCVDAYRQACEHGAKPCNSVQMSHTILAAVYDKYIRAYDYAKSIGAIE